MGTRMGPSKVTNSIFRIERDMPLYPEYFFPGEMEKKHFSDIRACTCMWVNTVLYKQKYSSGI